MLQSTFFKCFILLFMTLSLNASGSIVDSIASPELWLEEQNMLGQELLKKSQEFNRAVQIFEKAYHFAKANQLTDQFIEIGVGYGIAMYKNGDIKKSHTHLLEILPRIEEDKLKLKAEVNQILGMTLVFQDKYPEGYKYQTDALKYYSEIADSSGLLSVYYDLGANFITHGQSEMALENYEKGIAIAKSIKNPKKTMLGTTALGGVWASLNEFEKALSYIDESMQLAKMLNDEEELAWASINRGYVLGQTNQFKEAEFYLKQAYELSFKIENKLLTAYALEQLSEMNIKQDRLDQAIVGLDESYKIYQELGQSNSIKGVTKKYAEIYYKQKKFAKYKEYTDKYIALKDSLYSKEMMESMAGLKQDFEIYQLERENQIALLTKDQELAKAKNHATIAITGGAIVIFILLLILMYSRNKAATEKYELLTVKNAEILRQNEFLVNSNHDLEKFAYIISHDLKEPLRNINGFTKLLSRKVKKYTIDQDISDYATFITNSTHQMAELLNGLLTYSKVSSNKSEKEVVDLKKLVHNVMNSLKIQLDEQNCKVQINCLPQVVCKGTQLTQVFQNLIVNAIKFGPKTGNEIQIGTEDLGDEYRFYVKDNGIGIAPEYQKDIFVVFKRLHHRGTYSGSGIGLATCKKIVDDHGGQIWVESEDGKGATFYFTLPKKPLAEISFPTTPNLEKTSPFEVLETV